VDIHLPHLGQIKEKMFKGWGHVGVWLSKKIIIEKPVIPETERKFIRFLCLPYDAGLLYKEFVLIDEVHHLCIGI